MLRKISLGFLFAALVAGCGSARLVQRNQYGGVIALNGDRGKAYEQANNMMAQHCGPGNYQVVSEGEVPVGTDTMSRTDTNYGESTASSGNQSSTQGGQTTTSGTSTRTATEWRIQYQCGQGAGAPPPAGPPGPAQPMGPAPVTPAPQGPPPG